MLLKVPESTPKTKIQFPETVQCLVSENRCRCMKITIDCRIDGVLRIEKIVFCPINGVCPTDADLSN